MKTPGSHKRKRSFSLTPAQDGEAPPPAKRRKSPTLEQTPLLAVEPMPDSPMPDSPNPVKDGICRSSVLSEGKPVDPGQVSDETHETRSGKDQDQPSAKIMSPIDLTCQRTSLPVTTCEENPVTSTTDMKDRLGDNLPKSFEKESDEYDVEKIIDHSIYKDYTRYHVEWEGYIEKTWEGEGNFDKCPQLLIDYWKSSYVSLLNQHRLLKKRLGQNKRLRQNTQLRRNKRFIV
jgi:hypothetical protein